MATIDVKFFRSTDAGAPTLGGTAGYLINVLDALLLNGYNSKTITITRSGTTATATSSAHGFVQWQVVNISGADQGDYNGDFHVTSVPTANTFTFEVANSPATPATGTITCKVAAAGWTQAYSGTNKKVYQQDTAGTNRGFLRVDDTGTTTARIRGYTAMTDVDTGTNPYPTDAQLSGGLYALKSNSASTAARMWFCVASKRLLFFVVDSTSTPPAWNQSNAATWAFGTYKSFNSTDAYPQLIIGNNTSGVSSTNVFGSASQLGGSANAGHYLAANYSGGSFSKGFGKTNPVAIASSVFYQAIYAIPNGPDGKFNMGPFIVHEIDTTTVIRGTIPGLWGHCLYTPTIINNDTPGTVIEASSGSDLEGKRFITMVQYSSQYCLFEISDTWDT